MERRGCGLLLPVIVAGMLALLLTSACGSGTIMLDEGYKYGSDVGDSAATNDTAVNDSGAADSAAQDSAQTETGGEDSGQTDDDSADSGEDTDPSTSDCLEVLYVAHSTMNLASGSSFDAYDSSAGDYDAATATSNASLAVNSTAACALTVGGTIAGNVYTGADPSTGLCQEWGASISGSSGQLSAPIAMPALVAPAVGASTGDISLGWSQVHPLSGAAHFGSVDLQYGSILNFVGSSVVLVDGDLTVDGAAIVVPEGELVEVYVGGDVRVGFDSSLNRGGAPSQLRLYSLYGGAVTFDYGATVNAWIEAPNSTFANNGATFAGTFIGNAATAAWGAATHLDLAHACR